MPSRHTVKELLTDGIYHVFNRGVEKRKIFLSPKDYQRFKLMISQCLEREPGVTLLAFCLMPNHFHLLLHQGTPVGMSRFMQRLSTGYVMYFNRRYRRVGPLFQGKYKAVRVVGPDHLMEESRYIHLNPERAGLGWRQHQHSSVHQYLEPFEPGLAFPDQVLELFDSPDDYAAYLSRVEVRPRATNRNTTRSTSKK